jgi:hypothetical protein
MKPVARRSRLVVRELPDEVVVYDRDRHQAHCLNRTAAIVFRNADGRHTISDLAALLGGEDPRGVRETLVGLALERLAEAHLIEGEPVAVSAPGLSRRDVVRRVGLGAAVLLPMVASVLAPTPAEASATCATSCAPQQDGTSCTCTGVTPCTASCITCRDGMTACCSDCCPPGCL